MSLKLTARSLDVLPRQKISVPRYAALLDVKIDQRHNNCLLWVLGEDEEGHAQEKVEIIMLRVEETLTPQCAKYVGNFTTNGGQVHVFVSRNSDHPMVKIE